MRSPPELRSISSGSSDDLYSFKREDTYLHTFGIRNGNNLIKMLYSRLTISLLFVYGLFCIILTWTKPLTEFEHYSLFWCLFGFINWIWITFAICSVNRIALHLITKKFDFWIKIIFSIIFIISYSVWRIITNNHNNSNTNDIMYILQTILIGIDFILIITYYSLINGMQIKYKTKLYFGVSLSTITTTMWLQLTLWSGNNKNDLFTNLYAPYISFSWYYSALSSIQILCIFLWKTVYLTRKYREKSTIINTIPSIRWIEGQPIDQQVAQLCESHLCESHHRKKSPVNKEVAMQIGSTQINEHKFEHELEEQKDENEKEKVSKQRRMNNMDREMTMTQSNNDNCLYIDLESIDHTTTIHPNHRPLPLLPLITDTANQTEYDDPSCDAMTSDIIPIATPTPCTTTTIDPVKNMMSYTKQLRKYPTNEVSQQQCLECKQQYPKPFSPSTAL